MLQRSILLLALSALVAGCAPGASEFDGTYEVTSHTTDDGGGPVDVADPYVFFKLAPALYGLSASAVTAFYPCSSATDCDDAYESGLSLNAENDGWLDFKHTTSINGECSVEMTRVVFATTSTGVTVTVQDVGGVTTELEGCDIDNITDSFRDSLPVVTEEVIAGDIV
jgi:hypothetical protein